MSSTGNSPAGGPPVAPVPAFLRRNKQASNPLMKRKPAASRSIGPQSNGARHPRALTPSTAIKNLQTQAQTSSNEPCERIPIVTTKRQLIEGMRHHVIRFVPNASQVVQQVDPTEQSQFERPVRLHRRDPRDNKAYWEQEGLTTDDGKPILDEKERERLEAQRALRKAEKEAIQAQIAPNATTVKRDRFKHRTEQVFQKAESKQHGVTMRYEEQIPWHVEDFSDKNIWQGQYEEPLSNCHVMFLPENNAQGQRVFRMVPLEKWYKFAPKSKNEIIKFEEAERRAATGVKPPRWFMKRVEEQQQKAKAEPKMLDRMYKRTGARTERNRRKVKNEDDDDDDLFEGSDGGEGADEMDFDHDEEFQDDDENALFEGDEEEAKEAETRVKRELLQANVFDVKDQKDWDAEEAARKAREKLNKKKQKRTRKALLNREKNYIYDDDSDEDPYASESSEDSEEERIREEEERKKKEEEEAAAAAAAAAKTKEEGKDKTTFTPPKSNTPSGRLEKKDPLRKSLKRPGSPNLSETSGNESSTTRKKLKKKHLQKSGLSTSSNMSRAASPAGSQSSRLGPNGTSHRLAGSAGSGSDGEGSDNAPLKKQLKLKLNHGGSPGATPSGSRAGSPSAVGSPTDTATPPAGAKKQLTLPTPEELIAAVPPEGLALRMLMNKFKSSSRHPDFGPFIKTHLSMRKKNIDGKDTPWLYHKGAKLPGGPPTAAAAAAPSPTS